MFNLLSQWIGNQPPTECFNLYTSSDSVQITLPAVKLSNSVLSIALQNGKNYLEVPSDIFPFPVLKSIKAYLESPELEEKPLNPTFIDTEEFPILGKNLLFHLLLAAHHLNIESLFLSIRTFIFNILKDYRGPSQVRGYLRIPRDLPVDTPDSWWDELSTVDHSVSYMFDSCKGKPKGEVEIPPWLSFLRSRTPRMFVPDEHAFVCALCGTTFTAQLRKHHCRMCGQVICYNCSSNWLKLPQDICLPDVPATFFAQLLKTATSQNSQDEFELQSRKCCNLCFEAFAEDPLSKDSKLDIAFRAFDVLCLPLGLVYRAAMISEKWRRGVALLISLTREIQYTLPLNTFTERQKRILFINKDRWSGHSLWTVNFIKSLDWNDARSTEMALSVLRGEKNSSCLSCLCSRICTEKLSTQNALDLLSETIKSQEVRDFAVNLLEDATMQELLSLLPLLIRNLRYESNPVSSKLAGFLLRTALKEKEFRNDFLWSLLYEMNDHTDNHLKIILQKLLVNVGQEADGLIRTQQFVLALDKAILLSNDPEIAKNSMRILLEDLFQDGPVIVPLKPSSEAQSINLDTFRFLSSATRPFIVDLILNNNSPYKIMYKSEDIFKDYVVMNIIHLMNHALKREADLSRDEKLKNFQMLTYRVLPTSKNRGLIEMVPDVKTLREITSDERSGRNITNYFANNNRDSLADIWKVFGLSTAAYTMITYLLGVGDRHGDNVLLRKDGVMFHIDYGFVVGEDPHYLMPRVLFKSELIHGMGGQNDIYQEYFLDVYPKIYLIFRRYVNIFVQLLSLLPIDPRALEDHIKDRFLPGFSEEDAKNIVTERMEKSLDTLPVKIWESFRSLKQQLNAR